MMLSILNVTCSSLDSHFWCMEHLPTGDDHYMGEVWEVNFSLLNSKALPRLWEEGRFSGSYITSTVDKKPLEWRETNVCLVEVVGNFLCCHKVSISFIIWWKPSYVMEAQDRIHYMFSERNELHGITQQSFIIYSENVDVYFILFRILIVIIVLDLALIHVCLLCWV